MEVRSQPSGHLGHSCLHSRNSKCIRPWGGCELGVFRAQEGDRVPEMERQSSGSAQKPALRMYTAALFLQGQVPSCNQKQLEGAGSQEALRRPAQHLAGRRGPGGNGWPHRLAVLRTPFLTHRRQDSRAAPSGVCGVQYRAAPHCSSWPPAPLPLFPRPDTGPAVTSVR